ncbi:MAG: hypothetical protein IJR47_01565 [Clostridia bacterium]|nr:hypothetical protein [Clostridia bacterium]
MESRNKFSLVVLVILIIFALPIVMYNLVILFLPNPDKPRVTYGEFPFEITYEIDGDVKIISDIYVCKYKGVSITGAGKDREWECYVKSTNERNVCLFENEECKIMCSVGSGEYYMGDSIWCEQIGSNMPSIFGYIKAKDDLMLETEIKEKYKINILEAKLSSPLTNNLRKRFLWYF